MKPAPLLLLCLLALGLALSACVPVPALAPPTRVRVGGGLASGDLADEADVARPSNQSSLFSFSIGAHPLNLFLQEKYDTFDLGAGFLVENLSSASLARQTSLLGGYLEGGYPVWNQGKRQRGGAWRLSLIGRLEYLADTSQQGDTGWGSSAGLLFERLWWVQSTAAQVSNDGSFIGAYLGEGGFGLDVSANHREVGGQSYNALILSLSLRIPAIFGLFLIPLE